LQREVLHCMSDGSVSDFLVKRKAREILCRKSRDFVEVKDRKKTREMKISRKNLRLTAQKNFVRFTPKKLEKKNSRFFFLRFG
jgi:hypothetical protein